MATNNINFLHTGDEIIAALINGGLPKYVAENVELAFDVTELRKLVETEDILGLKVGPSIGDKRAEKIISILNGKIAPAMSQPCPDVAKPDTNMYKVPGLTLVFENDKAKLTPAKLNMKGEVMHDKDGDVIKDVAMKRFGPALQKLQQISGQKENIVFTTTSEIAPDYRDPKKEFEMQAYWHALTHKGMTMKGELWVPGIMGTNARMKSQIHWIRVRDKKALRLWMACGANFNGKKVNMAKTEAYFGLLLPYTKDLLDNRLDPTMEALIPEWEHEHEGKNMFISPDGKMELALAYMVNEFDGMVVIDVSKELIDKMNLTRSERRRLERAIVKFDGGTMRGPWHKGVIVTGVQFRNMLKKMGLKEWNGKPVDEIAIWGDMSVFKASIGDDGLYEKFEDFAASFKGLNHRFGVLLENHGVKKTFLPSQQLQAAHGCDKKWIEQGADMEVEYLNAATDPQVAALRYEPAVIAQIAQVDPSIMATWFAGEMARNGYNKEFKSALAGRTHGENRTGFVVKDIVAFAQWICYLAGVRKELPTGCVDAYKVFAPTAGITGPAVASRNPVIANYGLPIVEVVDSVGEWDEFFEENFSYMMVSIHDALCKLLRMDHDGDKMRLTFDEWFVEAIKSINSDYLFAEWTNFGSVDKVEMTEENEANNWENCTMAPRLGMNVDNCGKLIAHGLLDTAERNWLADYMMNKGTDVKQGADGSNVGGEAGKIWAAMNADNKDAKVSKAMAYGKMQKGRILNADDVDPEYGESNLDIISRAVKERATKTLNYTGYFDPHQVMFSHTKTVQGLCGNWYDKETKSYKRGLFDEMVGRNKDMWSKADETALKAGLKEYLAWQRMTAIKEIEEFAHVQGLKLADAYDTITLYIFETLRVKLARLNAATKVEDPEKAAEAKRKYENTMKWCVVLARTYIQWFGGMIGEVFCTNHEMGFLPPVDEPVEMDEDVFDC